MAERMGNERLDVLNRFLVRLLEDREADGERPLEHYQALFPGFEELIAQEYASVLDGRRTEEAPAVPGRAT